MAKHANKKKRRRVRKREPAWVQLSDEELLDKRFCDLKIRSPGVEVELAMREIQRNLERRGIRFKPHVWLSEEWFSPDGVPGVAVPFYMAHPRLMRLERKMTREVEGGNVNWFMRILRHEVGHAFDSAYQIGRAHV